MDGLLDQLDLVRRERAAESNRVLWRVSAIAIDPEPAFFAKRHAQRAASLNVFLHPCTHFYFHVSDALLEQLSDSSGQLVGRFDAHHADDPHLRTKRPAPQRMAGKIRQFAS